MRHSLPEILTIFRELTPENKARLFAQARLSRKRTAAGNRAVVGERRLEGKVEIGK